MNINNILIMANNKYKDKGISGLVNLGNTCFLNSTMQVISHTYELNDFLDNDTYKSKLNKKIDSVLLTEWDELRKLLWSDNNIISPNRFVKAVQSIASHKKISIFTGYSQNDLPEFLIFVIDCFHNALSRQVNMSIEGSPKDEKDQMAIKCFEKIKQMYEKDYSEMLRLFYGIQVSNVKNRDTDVLISMNPEPFFIINLPIPQNMSSPSLLDCFDLYTEYEVLDDNNKIRIEETNEEVAVKKNILFWSFPEILVIDIKRFNANNRKNQIIVSFPLSNLDLSKYVVGYSKNSYVYDLYGVCNHSGSTLGGHYTSFVKNANNKWYHFNDGSVSEISDEQSIVTPKAYCFFYRKRQA